MMRRMANAAPPPPPQVPSITLDEEAILTTSASTATTSATITTVDQQQQYRSQGPSSIATPRRNRNAPSSQQGVSQTTPDAAPPRAMPFDQRSLPMEVPSKFKTVARPQEPWTTTAPTVTITATPPDPDLPVMTTMVGSEKHGKMAEFEVPDPPIWVAYFLAIFIISGFVVSAVLACVIFPLDPSIFSMRGTKIRVSEKWRALRYPRRRERRGRYLSVTGDLDDNTHQDPDDDEENDRYEERPWDFALGKGLGTSSAEASPVLAMHTVRKRRAKNPKNLSVRTEGVGYKGLGICVRDREGLVSASGRESGSPAVISSSPYSSAPEKSVLGGAREFLLGDKDLESSVEGREVHGKGFLKGVEKVMEDAAAWLARILHREVRGAEEGLLVSVRDCERDGRTTQGKTAKGILQEEVDLETRVQNEGRQ